METTTENIAMEDLCTVLPPLPPSLEDRPYWTITTPRWEDRVWPEEITLLIAECLRDGIPCSVQYQPVIPDWDREPQHRSAAWWQARMEEADEAQPLAANFATLGTRFYGEAY